VKAGTRWSFWQALSGEVAAMPRRSATLNGEPQPRPGECNCLGGTLAHWRTLCVTSQGPRYKPELGRHWHWQAPLEGARAVTPPPAGPSPPGGPGSAPGWGSGGP
jgi:hypothetical protein